MAAVSGWTLAVTLLGCLVSTVLTLWLVESGRLPGPVREEAEDV